MLLAISDRERCPIDFESWCRQLAEAGAPAVLIREKRMDDRSLLDFVRLARRLLPLPVRLLVSGRADIALAAGADGVHLPSRGVSTRRIRAGFGHRLLVGRSTHSIEEIEQQRIENVDYVTFGPVWPTPGKGPPCGPERLARAAQQGVPVLALGGVTLARLAAIAEVGAAGAAGIRQFWSPGELPEMLAECRRRFPEGWDRLRVQ